MGVILSMWPSVLPILWNAGGVELKKKVNGPKSPKKLKKVEKSLKGWKKLKKVFKSWKNFKFASSLCKKCKNSEEKMPKNWI